MANYVETSELISNLFDSVKEKTSIPQWVEFMVLSNNKQKEIYKTVKMNDLVTKLTDGINFAVVINEEMFEQLPPNMQEILFVESIAGINVSEHDAVSIEKPDFNTFTGVLQKYGHVEIIKLKESVKSLYDQKKQKDDEAKAQKKAKRAENAIKKAGK